MENKTDTNAWMAEHFEALVQRYHVGLIIYCENIVSDRDEAEDLAQEAFVKAYLELSHFDSKRAQFSTWLYKIATNLAIDHLRKRNRRIGAIDLETITAASMPTFLEEEERREVRSAVASLQPPEYRKVIEAYYWKGQSYQQIAHSMHVPINTVRTWIRRAKQQLKEKLL